MTEMLLALAIPTVLFLVLVGALIRAGRSWVNVLLVLPGIWIVLILIGLVSSGREALLFSLASHIILIAGLIFSFLRFRRREDL